MEETILNDKRLCYACGSSETLIEKRNGRPLWIFNHDTEDNVVCTRCYDIFRDKTKRKAQKSMNYFAHKKEKIEKVATYYEKNKDRILARRKAFYAKNKARLKPAHAIMQARKRWEYRLAIIDLLGGHCVKCGISDFRVMQLDHKRGQGLAEINSIFQRNYARMYKHYLINPEKAREDLQVLCANCNIVKKYENGEIRHYFDVFGPPTVTTMQSQSRQ